MATHSRRPLARIQPLLLELLVVFLGVVIALAADSWRESLVERRTETQYLRTLRDDLARSDSVLASATADIQENLRELTTFLDLVLSEDPLPDTLQTVGMSLYQFSLSTGTLDALIDGGQIHLIEDAGLRGAIIETRGEIEDLLHMRDQIGEEAGTNFREWVITYSVLRNAGGYPLGPMPAEVVRTSPVFQGQYRFHRNMLQNSLRLIEGLRSTIGSLLGRLTEVE